MEGPLLSASIEEAPVLKSAFAPRPPRRLLSRFFTVGSDIRSESQIIPNHQTQV